MRRQINNLLMLTIPLFALPVEANAQQLRDAHGAPLPDGAIGRIGSVRWRFPDNITFAAFLPDGKTLLTVDAKRTIQMWEYPSGTEKRCRISVPAAEGRPPSFDRDARIQVALSHDGKTIAACARENEILVLDVATGKKLQVLHAGPVLEGPRKEGKLAVRSLAFSPSGLQLAVLNWDGTCGIWDWANGKELHTLSSPSRGAKGTHGHIVWSPDGKTLAVLKESNWLDRTDEKKAANPAGGKRVPPFDGVKIRHECAIEIWDTAAAKKLRTVTPKIANESGRALGLAFCADGKALAYGWMKNSGLEGRIALVDVSTGKERPEWVVHRRTQVLLFSPDGAKLYGRSEDGVLTEWGAADGQALRSIDINEPGNPLSLLSAAHAAWSPDGRHLVVYGGTVLHFIDVVAGKKLDPSVNAASLQFTPDGKSLWTTTAQGARKWDVATGQPVDLPALPNVNPHGPCSPDGKVLVASMSNGERAGALLDAGTGKQLGVLPPIESMRSLAFSPAGAVLAMRQRSANEIALHETSTGNRLRGLALNPTPEKPAETRGAAAPGVLFFSPDSKKLAAFADTKTLVVWDVETGQRAGALLPADAANVRGGAFAPDGRGIVLDFSDGTALLYDLPSGQVRQTYGLRELPKEDRKFLLSSRPDFTVSKPCVVFGTEGQTLIHVGGDQLIHVWEVKSGKELGYFKGHTGAVEAIALSADGKTLASAGADQTVLLWDVARAQRPVLEKTAAKGAPGALLPDGALARIGTTNWTHGGQVLRAVFLPDGKTVISAGADRIIRVWEYPSGKELRQIGPRPSEPRSRIARGAEFPVAFSKDGKLVAASFARSQILMFDVTNGRELKMLEAHRERGGHFPETQSLAFSPDGRQLAELTGDGTGRVWDWSAGWATHTFATPNPKFENYAVPLEGAVGWSPDGKILATVRQDSEGNRSVMALEAWEPGKGVRWRKVVSRFPSDVKVVFSPDGKTLALTDDGGRIILLNVATGKEIRNWPGERASQLLLFSPDGAKLYARSVREETVVEWDAATGEVLRNFSVYTLGRDPGPPSIGRGSGASWSPDGKILVLTGAGSTLQFVDVAAGKIIDTGAGLVFSVSSLLFSPDSTQLWTRNGNGSVRKWDAATGKPSQLPAALAKPLKTLLSPDGKLLVAPSSTEPANGVFLDAATGKELGVLPGLFPRFPEVDMLFSNDSRMLAVRRPRLRAKTIMLFAAPGGKQLHSLAIDPIPNMPGQPVRAAPAITFFAPDSKRLAAFADPDTLAVWDTVSGLLIAKITINNSLGMQRSLGIDSGAFSPDGRCIALDLRDGGTIMYELASAHGRGTCGTQASASGSRSLAAIPPTRIAFGPDGRTLFRTGVDHAIDAWDVDTGKQLHVFTGHAGSIDTVALAPNGKLLASASGDNTVLVWDTTRIKRPAPVVHTLSPEEREACWQTLTDDDAARAFAAIRDLSASPDETLALLSERLKPLPPAEMKRVDALVAGLASDQFKTRQDASAALLKLDERALPAIDRMLATKPPLEVKRRLDDVRQHLGGAGMVLHGEPLRMYRAVEVLERIGTPAARQLLQAVADGPPGIPLTIAAQATLQRLTPAK